MNPKIVLLFFAGEGVGGIEMLWIRLARLLQDECDIFVLDNCKRSIFRKLLKNEKVTFLDFDFKGTIVPDDAVIIAPLNYPSLSGCLKGKNLRFLFWSLYDKSPLCVETYRWLHLFENKLQIDFSKETEKHLMQCMNPLLYRHLKAFYKVANEKNALIYMQKDNIIFDEAYFDMKLKENIIPLGIEVPDPIKLNMQPNFIRACWLGRFVGFKYNAIKNIIVGLHDFCQKHPEINIHLDLIGKGDFENQVKQDCTAYKLSNFSMELKGEIIGDALQNYLQENVDLLCADGTSILESAKYGIPALVCNGGIGRHRINYPWLFELPLVYIGSLLYEYTGHTMEECLTLLQNNYKPIGKKCYQVVNDYFNINTVARKFLQTVQTASLTSEDIEKTKITRHTFWAKKIEKIRKNG